MIRIYAIEHGAFFYGTPEQFEDCFFFNSDEQSAREFAEEQGCTFHSFEGEIIDFTGLSNDEAEIAMMKQIQEATGTQLFH